MIDRGEHGKTYSLCGIAVAPLATRHDAMERVRQHLRSGYGVLHIVTVNPEILLRTHRDAHYRATVAAAQMRTIDGFGVIMALWWRYRIRAQRVTGVDLLSSICSMAAQNNFRVHCAVRSDGLSPATLVEEVLRTRYPGLVITAHAYTVAEKHGGIVCDLAPDVSSADIVLCGFGAPAQEYFLQSLSRAGRRHVAIGVGGAFDFLTGTVCRAPHVMRRYGIEWLWRVAVQPLRIVRIVRATIIFPCVILFRRDARDVVVIGQKRKSSV